LTWPETVPARLIQILEICDTPFAGAVVEASKFTHITYILIFFSLAIVI